MDITTNPITNIAFGKIANALKSVASDNILGVANDIYDENLQQYQSSINNQFKTCITSLEDNLEVLNGDSGIGGCVKKSGDTMTGDLTIKGATSGSPSIVLQRGETNDIYEDWRFINNSGVLKIQNRNNSGSWIDVLNSSARTDKKLTSSYHILPSANNSLSIGNSDYKWANIYATNLYGTLNGNSSTSTNSNKLNDWSKSDIHAYSETTLYSIFDTSPLLINNVNLGNSCTVVVAPDNSTPFNKVWKCTGYTYWTSNKYLYFTPGDTICIESWIMRQSGSTGTAGTYYMGIEFEDKNGNYVGTNNGSVYFSKSNNYTCPSNGIWQKIYDEYTIPVSHVPYTTSDGGAYFRGKLRILLNYDKGTIPTFFGGVRIYKKNIATSTKPGNILVTGDVLGSVSINTPGSTSGKYYPVQLTADGKAVVNVPWANTSVTGVANHYTPAADANAKLTASASGATAAWGIDVVKGVSVQRDAKGHVTSISVTSGKIPSAVNCFNKVACIVGSSTTNIVADSTADTLSLACDDYIKISGDATNDKITIEHSTSGVTSGSYGPANNVTPAYGGSFNVPYITVNSAGHITSAATRTVKIPAAQTFPSAATNDEINNLFA